MDVVTAQRPRGSFQRPVWVKPLLYALGAAAALLAFYLGLITLAQGWDHALQQLREDRWFVAAISVGFGTQVGLFMYLRALVARSNPAAMAASTGTSTVAMVACCAHHLADALPLIGLSGAAVFLNDFKGPILWAGITMNVLGIAYLGRKIYQQRPRAGPRGLARRARARGKRSSTWTARQGVGLVDAAQQRRLGLLVWALASVFSSALGGGPGQFSGSRWAARRRSRRTTTPPAIAKSAVTTARPAVSPPGRLLLVDKVAGAAGAV